MKKYLVLAVGALWALQTGWAGGACCASKKTQGDSAKVETLTVAEADAKGCGSGVFEQLNLTEDQQARLAELKSTCSKDKCSDAEHEKFMSGLKEILTTEQMAKCKTICEENGWKCPVDPATKADAGAPSEG